MKWKHRQRPIDVNGFINSFYKRVKFFKKPHTESQLFMTLQHRGYNLGTGGWSNFRENSKRLHAAVDRIKRMHHEYHRRHK